MAEVLHYLSAICLLLGVVFMLVGALGVLRMPDALTQLHAAGVTDTLGAALILIGLAVESGAGLLSGKLLIILFFLVFTNPAASHSLARAVKHYRDRPWKEKQENTQAEYGGEARE